MSDMAGQNTASAPLSIEAVLEREGSYASVTKGPSMRPLFRTGRDMIVLVPPSPAPRKYDVVLYRVGDKYILHRIIKVKDDAYIIRGDNTFVKERVPGTAVIARLVSFNRGGRHHTVDEIGYKLYSRVWNFIYPARYILHRLHRCASFIIRPFRKAKK